MHITEKEEKKVKRKEKKQKWKSEKNGGFMLRDQTTRSHGCIIHGQLDLV